MFECRLASRCALQRPTWMSNSQKTYLSCVSCAALISLICWVGSIGIWKHPQCKVDVHLQLPTSQRNIIEAETIETAMQLFSQQRQCQACVVIVQSKHAAACLKGTLAVCGTESKELLHAQIVKELILTVRNRAYSSSVK